MSLILTRTQNMRANSQIDKNEYRPSKWGALDLFMSQGEGLLSPELIQKAYNSIGSTLQTPVINYDGDVSIGNTRSVTIADSENTSQMVTITFQTYSWGFTQVPTMFNNNEISAQRDFETKMQKYIFKFANDVDTACLAALAAAKTQVIDDKLGYTVTGNVVQAPFAKHERTIGDVEVMQNSNDFYYTNHLVANTGTQALLNQLTKHGTYNDKNNRFEFAGRPIHYTNRLKSGAGEAGRFYMVSEGQAGILTRFEREAVIGRKTQDGHEWGIARLPYIDMPVGTYYYESVGDYSAINGDASADMTRSFKQHFGFSVDIATVTAYNSDPTTLPSPYISVALLEEVEA